MDIEHRGWFSVLRDFDSGQLGFLTGLPTGNPQPQACLLGGATGKIWKHTSPSLRQIFNKALSWPTRVIDFDFETKCSEDGTI